MRPCHPPRPFARLEGFGLALCTLRLCVGLHHHLDGSLLRVNALQLIYIPAAYKT